MPRLPLFALVAPIVLAGCAAAGPPPPPRAPLTFADQPRTLDAQLAAVRAVVEKYVISPWRRPKDGGRSAAMNR